MILYYDDIGRNWAGNTYSRKHLEREDLNIDLELYTKVPLE